MTTDPGHVSRHLTELLLGLCTADQLQHLAAIKREREPYLVARRRLSEASREELAEMLTANRTPTVGWWRGRQTEQAS